MHKLQTLFEVFLSFDDYDDGLIVFSGFMSNAEWPKWSFFMHMLTWGPIMTLYNYSQVLGTMHQWEVAYIKTWHTSISHNIKPPASSSFFMIKNAIESID